MTRAQDRTNELRDVQPVTRSGRHGPRERRLAQVLACGLAAVVGFQLALVAGAPWGSAAWGGSIRGQLSAELRVASAFAACFWLGAMLTALSRGGIAASPIPYTFSRRATWGLTALLAVGAVMNAASSSRWERYGWTPLILGLTVLSLQLARARRHSQSSEPASQACGVRSSQ